MGSKRGNLTIASMQKKAPPDAWDNCRKDDWSDELQARGCI